MALLNATIASVWRFSQSKAIPLFVYAKSFSGANMIDWSKDSIAPSKSWIIPREIPLNKNMSASSMPRSIN